MIFNENFAVMSKNKHLIISGAIFTAVLFVWPVFMALWGPKGDIQQQLEWVSNNRGKVFWQYFLAFLIAPSIIYMMISQLYQFTEDAFRIRLGLIFIAVYAVLNSIAYASQIFLVPRLIEHGLTDIAKTWYFFSPFSVSYFFNQMGYAFWALGTMMMFYKYMSKKGMIQIISILYVFSAVLSFVAFAGLAVENQTINSMTLYSGLVLAPVGILSIIWGMKNRKNNPENV